MPLSAAPIQEAISRSDGYTNQVWVRWFQSLYQLMKAGQPWVLASYNVASVPNASGYTGGLIFVPDETGGATVAFSDGTNWRRVQDRAIIS